MPWLMRRSGPPQIHHVLLKVGDHFKKHFIGSNSFYILILIQCVLKWIWKISIISGGWGAIKTHTSYFLPNNQTFFLFPWQLHALISCIYLVEVTGVISKQAKAALPLAASGSTIACIIKELEKPSSLSESVHLSLFRLSLPRVEPRSLVQSAPVITGPATVLFSWMWN